MQLNTDTRLRTRVHGAQLPWQPSPMPGVERRMFYREGAELARATSLVRYAPGSHFSAHRHPGGEEFLVLEGTFEDEYGRYPPGTYVRNPPGSRHAPGSSEGCLIFVRLLQFAEGDRQPWQVRTNPQGAEPGTCRLFGNRHERISLHTWAAGSEHCLDNAAGSELLVLSGSLIEGGEHLAALSWLRLPAGWPLRVRVGAAGARVWLREARLPNSNAPLGSDLPQ